jgi:GH15 family glucan-1,4-alpha-glucosidase
MAWVAFDRAIRLARELDHEADVHRWERVRRDIRSRVERDGVRDGVFVRSFGADTLDASALLIPLVGFLPATDERVVETVRRIEGELGAHGLVHRYLEPDGLPGDEGCFVACSFWLAAAYARMGETGHAREVFEGTAGYANDLGLLAEQADPETGELLGNFPQAFSHLALIGAATAIKEAERERTDSRPRASAPVPSPAG